MYRRLAWLISLAPLLVAGCTGGGQPCETNRDCPDDHICRYDQCLETDWTDESPTVAPDVETDGSMPDTDPAVGPRLEAPETVEFDAPDDEQTIEVSNTGDEAVTIESRNLDDEAFSLTSLHFRSDGGEQPAEIPARLSPGETLAIGIRYASAELGTHQGTLLLETTPEEARTSIELVGQTDGCIEVMSSDTLRFNTDSPGGQDGQTIRARNCGDYASVSVSAELRGEDADAFEFPFSDYEVQLTPGEEASAPLTFGPTDEPGSYEAELVIETNLPNREQIVIDLAGRVGVDCPTPQIEPLLESTDEPLEDGTTTPRTRVVLDASGSEPADAIESYQWTTLNAPPNAEPMFRPDNNAPAPEISLDFAGVWTFELTLEGPEQWESCEPATVTIRAVPDDIYVELNWTTPGDEDPDDGIGGDLDLHYLHPKAGSWASEPWDIFWGNRNADWGQPGSSDDPEFRGDADHAPGPESVDHDNPSPGKNYTVGVYYYADSGLGASYATVRIFIDGELARGWSDRKLAESSDFWKVAQIEWPSGNIYERDTMHEGYPRVQ